jgi:hypothetical protein
VTGALGGGPYSWGCYCGAQSDPVFATTADAIDAMEAHLVGHPEQCSLFWGSHACDKVEGHTDTDPVHLCGPSTPLGGDPDDPDDDVPCTEAVVIGDGPAALIRHWLYYEDGTNSWGPWRLGEVFR